MIVTLTLLKDVECYCPEYSGRKDILIANEKIDLIRPAGDIKDTGLITMVIPCENFMAFPSLIDQHVHITGGGEDGLLNRMPEIQLNEIIKAGVSTLVGVLGSDSYTKGLKGLLSKARSLELMGITTYIYTGSYAVPPPTITGSVINDLVLIDKVIGTGEVAISDHRSSQPRIEELIKLASDTHIGSIIGRKAGVVHIHLGDEETGLDLLNDLIGQTDLPIGMFVPTHVNRNKKLFNQALNYLSKGGNIDLTADEQKGLSVPDAVSRLIEEKSDLDRVTLSSDANSSSPSNGHGENRVPLQRHNKVH